MRSESGVLGKTDIDGARPGRDPTARMIRHVNAALAKSADGERFIYVDVNTVPVDPKKFFAKGEAALPRLVTDPEIKLENLERRINGVV